MDEIKPLRCDPQVIIRDSAVVLRPGGDYTIGLERIQTPQDLLGWLLHLGRKQWFSRELEAEFILTVSRRQSFGVPESI